MAGSPQAPVGVSYAQAAKGRAQQAMAQTPPSKANSGPATPANGTLADLGSSSNWADDVEISAGEKGPDSQTSSTETVRDSKPSDTMMDRAKPDGTVPNASPDLVISDIITSTNHDETSSASSAVIGNGTSSPDTTWENKSQASDPAWIAERKERQSAPQHHEQNPKSGKKQAREPKEPALPQPPPKPIVFHDAPIPTVNCWHKRREDANKAKAQQAPHVATSSPNATPTATTGAVETENLHIRAESRKKATSIPDIPREAEQQTKSTEQKKPDTLQSERGNTIRNSVVHQNATNAGSGRNNSAAAPGPSKSAQREHQSMPNLPTVPPPSVKDEVSWPTPMTAKEMERKEPSAERDSESESAPEGKARPKTNWKPLAVTPNIVWETPEMNRPRGQAGERGSRGGSGPRGRGGLRGGANGAKAGDRTATRTNSNPSDAESSTAQRGRSGPSDREAMPPPAKPARATSGSGTREAPNARHQSLSKSSGKPGPKAAPANSVFESRRTKSPSKMDPVIVNGHNKLPIPEPIPRATFAPTETEHARESADAPARDTQTRTTHADARKEARSYESYNKDWNGNGTPRGGKRGGRGRGGSREYANGHAANQPYANGHAEYMGSPVYAMAPSSSAFGRTTAYGMPQQGRGGWSRGNPRSQSIPIDNAYGARVTPFAPQSQVFYPPMYEYNAANMSPMAYSPIAEHESLIGTVFSQLEYYFSLDNLLKDMYLRRNMDSQGFVFLDVIANFNRIKHLTTDRDILRVACLRSENIEIKIGEDGKERLRLRDGWDRFLLPVEQRELSAQTDGPQVLQRPEQPQMPAWTAAGAFQMRGFTPNGLPSPRQGRSYDSGVPSFNGMGPQYAQFAPASEFSYGQVPNGEETRGRAPKSPMRELGFSVDQLTSHAQDTEPDGFPDEHANALTVVVKLENPSRVRHHHAGSRTFSNGSIDSRSIFGETEKSNDGQSPLIINGEAPTNVDSSEVGEPRQVNSADATSPTKASSDTGLTLLWVKDTEVPQEQLPQGVTLEPYFTLRDKAFKQRSQAATGTCPYDLDVLYQFWSHFLIRNFNKQMYKEFVSSAHDDAHSRHSVVGLQNLARFYDKALLSSTGIRDAVMQDYVDLVKNEPSLLQDLAFKQLRGAYRNGALNLKTRKKLGDLVDESLKSRLES